MWRIVQGLAAALLLASPLCAQTPAEPDNPAARAAAGLATPPVGARVWLTTAGDVERGRSSVWRDAAGALWSRQSFTRAGFFAETDQRLVLGPDGTILEAEIRGATTQGEAGERYASTSGYRTPADAGPPAPKGAFYYPYGPGLGADIAMIEALLKSPSKSLTLHPGGTARIAPLTELDVSNGRESKRLVAYAIDGLGYSPMIVWTDNGQFFGTAGRLSTLPEGWRAVSDALNTAQQAALTARGEALVERVAPLARGPVAFRNVRLFDSRAGVFRPAMTVVVQDGRVAAVGPAASVRMPAGAQVIDGAGKTLVPALWDSHSHFGADEMGVRLLSQGIAHIRDPGNDLETSVPRRQRIEAGRLLGPHIVASLMIDGPGPLASIGLLVANREEALAAVGKAKAAGFTGVKLYGSLDPQLVAPIAAEAHRLGLRVHGHIQRGFRPADAVAAGYDEITHINWVMMQGMPQSVIDKSNGLDRFYGPYRYGPALDFKAEPMNGFLADLAERKIVVDPTLVVFEGDSIARDELLPGLRAFAGALPPLVERFSKGADIAPTAEVPVEQIARGFAKWKSLVKELHDRGVPIVAGTDGSGLELVRELELYVEAGLTPAEALQTATIVPATQFGLGDRTGALEVGKQADLLLVDGDPSRTIGDLRRVQYVMHRGRLMKGTDLRAAVGLGELRR